MLDIRRMISCGLLVVLLLPACKKIEVPDPVFGDPVFLLDGQVDSENISLVAGDDDYHMFTSTAQDTNGVYEFTGHLQPENCNGCGPAIKIRFRDEAVRNAQQVNIETAIQTGDYDYFTSQSTVAELHYMVNFSAIHTSSENAEPVSYRWDFGDGSGPSFEANPQHEYPDDADRLVSLEIQDAQDCSSYYEKMISFDSTQSGCGVDFSIFQIQGGTLLDLQSTAEGIPPYAYNWSTGETTSSIFFPVQVDSVPAFFNFCLTLTDSGGCQASRCRDVYFLEPPSPALPAEVDFCKTDFSAETNIDTLTQFDPLQFSTVIVEYTDAQGEIYRSDLGGQSPGTHFFRVQTVEDFMNNEDGLPTKKLELLFSCKVFSENGSAVELRNINSQFAVGYPEG